MPTVAIVLAAGKGSRMNSDLAKVLHLAAGRPLILWMLNTLADAEIHDVAVVVGHQADQVRAVLPDDVKTPLQRDQNGTGHATSVGLTAFDAVPETVLVLPGDMPLIRPATLRSLLDAHRTSGAAATVLSVLAENPTGYGRLIHSNGELVAIVEEGDATQDQRTIKEVNTSVIVFHGETLLKALEGLDTENSQGELYLTDVIAVLHEAGHTLRSYITDAEEGFGVNSVRQLEVATSILSRRRQSNTD
ncbi:MAG: NTP transferase domain-containing protein [Acidobacteria bacterium]|nr:NTP transferase domain-containing protein [Acidobacteriota bacterium]